MLAAVAPPARRMQVPISFGSTGKPLVTSPRFGNKSASIILQLAKQTVGPHAAQAQGAGMEGVIDDAN